MEWPTILEALPGRTRTAINQMARGVKLHRTIRRHRRWSDAEKLILWRLYPSADASEVEAALPGRGSLATIAKTANALGIKRQTFGTRTNKRYVHPIIKELRAERERLKMTRHMVSEKSGYHRNQLLGWELGKTNPDFRSLREWAEGLGFDLVLRKRIVSDDTGLIPWPDRSRLMAGR